MTKVSLTQFLRPDGRAEPVSVDVALSGEADAALSSLVLTCEVLLTGQVAIYGRWGDQDEEDEILKLATNSAGPNQPDLVLGRLIEELVAQRAGVLS